MLISYEIGIYFPIREKRPLTGVNGLFIRSRIKLCLLPVQQPLVCGRGPDA